MAGTVLAGLVLAACGSTRDTSTGASVDNVINLVVRGNADVAMGNEVASAQYLLTARCMSEHGFKMAVPPSPPSSSQQRVPIVLSEGEALTVVPPESATLRLAAEEGFGIATRRSKPSPIRTGYTRAFRTSAPSTRKLSPTQTAYRTALVGPGGSTATFTVAGIAQHTYPTKGCGADAYAALYGSPLLAIEANYLPEDLNLAVTHNVDVNPAFIAATKRWSACMATATGQTVSEPYNVPNELLAAEESGSSPLTPRQRAQEEKVAVADARCQYHSRLVQTSVELRRRFATQLSGPYEGLLLTIIEARSRASRKAQAVLVAAGR